jgi:hypothetical protein
VVGFLPGYLDEEGLADGRSRFSLLRAVVARTGGRGGGLVVIAAVALVAARQTDPERPGRAPSRCVGVALAIAGITYPWYALLLVAARGARRALEWLAVAAAAYPGYLAIPLGCRSARRSGSATRLALALVALIAWRRAASP